MNNQAAIFLPTGSAAAIFENEIKGQLSDGMWENTQPFDHWVFWSDLLVNVEPGCVPSVRPLDSQSVTLSCKKNGYNIAGLFEYVGDRMLAYGRMGRAAESVGHREGCDGFGQAAAYMPSTLEEWRDIKSGKSLDTYEYAVEYLRELPDAFGVAWYKTTYDVAAMKNDVRLIKKAMKTVPIR